MSRPATRHPLRPAAIAVGVIALLLVSNAGVAYAAAQITTSQIADGAVTSAKIRNATVSTADLADDAATWDELARNSVSDYQLYDEAVIGSKIAPLAVTADKIGTGAVTGPKVAPNALGGAQVDEKSLDLAASCSRGLIRGFVRFDSAALPARQWVDAPQPSHNCTGGRVQLYRHSTGKVLVQFTGLDSLYAAATPLADWRSRTTLPGDDGFQSTLPKPEVYVMTTGGAPAFYVQTWSGDQLRDGAVSLVAF